MGDGPIVIVLNRAIDIWLDDRRTAFHDLARVHTALSGICGAPVHPRTLVSNRKEFIFTVREIIQNSQTVDRHRAYHHVYVFWFQAIEELPAQADSFKVYKHSSKNFKSILRNHLAFDQIPMPLTIHFFIIQKDTFLGPGTHEMVVAGAGCEAAAHSGSWLLAEFTSQLLASNDSHVHILQ